MNAIYEPAIAQFVAEARALVGSMHEAEAQSMKLERLLGESREAAQMRRIEVGAMLLRHRSQLPKRGTKENGWGAYLEAIEMDEATAWRYMRLADNQSAAVDPNLSLKDKQVGPEPDPAAPPPHDDDAGPELALEQGVQQDGPEIDRDTWCTPKWLTDALGEVDLDPCANERSHVQARTSFRLDHGEDGLELAARVDGDKVVFVNPPYSDVTPWIQAYGHAEFVFLLKFDPSTKWFAMLIANTALVLFPKGTRVKFEAPDGVPPEKAEAPQFPHALFFARASDASESLLNLCFAWRLR